MQTFADVQESDWFYDAVCYVTDNGLMNGAGRGFAPQQTTMLYRYAQRKGLVRAAAYADRSGFADAASVSAYAGEAMQWAVANGILTGMGGKLCPQGNATRAQVAQILYRLCEKWDLLPADNTAAIASAIYLADDPEHTHVWTYTSNQNGTHSAACTCGETTTEYCTLIHQTGRSWKCSACGFVVEGTTDAGVSTWEELKEAVKNGKSPIYLAADIAVEELITFTGDTTIYGTGHKLTIAEGVTLPRMLEAGSHKLTLNGLTLDGENKTCEDFQGIINAGNGSTLTLEEVTIQNFNAYRILRTIEADEASLTNVTIKDNTLKSYHADLSCVLLLNSTPKAKMKNVTITGNQTDQILIYLVGTTNLEAEELTVEDNKVGTHLVTTASTSDANTYTFTSGSIKHNTDNGQGFFVVSNITIGRDMLVECNIVINNDGNNGVCTLTNNGLIVGDIQARWTDKRGEPIYTGTGTHIGTKTNIQDQTVSP